MQGNSLPIIEGPISPEAVRKTRPVGLRPWQRNTSRVSTELFVFNEKPHVYVVFAPIRQLAFRANATLVNALADLQLGRDVGYDADLIEFLQGIRLIDVPKDRLPAEKDFGEYLPTSVTLFLTTACNLRCSYCYASAGDTPQEFMPFATAQKAIDFIIANALHLKETSIEVRYHGGGEPTVNWTTLKQSFEYAKQRGEENGLNVSGTAATNGLLSAEQIDWVTANLRGVNLSWDGLPEIQDEQRPSAGGRGSSQRVLSTLRAFNDRDFRYGIRVTVTDRSLPLLSDCVEFICQHATCALLHVEPAFQVGRCGHGDSLPPNVDLFIRQFHEAQNIAEEFGVELYYSGSRVDQRTGQFCGAVGDSFSIAPSGNVSACYEVFTERDPRADVFFYGTYDESVRRYIFDYQRLDRLRRRTVHQLPECSDCLCKWHCAGDCLAKAALNGPIEHGGATDRCHINISLSQHEILRKIDQSGGFIWIGDPSETGFTSCSI